MSQSTNANLYYGIQLEEEFVFVWKKEDLEWEDLEWEDYYAKKMGIDPPEEEYSDETAKIYSEYWDKVRKIVKNGNCEIMELPYEEPKWWLSSMWC